ncbi:MAG TPA: T9SS type A sorting domain-containing protein, partial [Flavobacteriales bacterium]|nr:T9SS type A sorting domain-containing protein [Flavobacteriales bacterium]
PTLLGSFTGASLPGVVTSTGGAMYVHFTSDNSFADAGWAATYTSTVSSGGSYCSGTTNLTASMGFFDDGSGINDYGDYADCKWLIQPSGAATISLNFNSFDTQTGIDLVTVYDGSTTSAPVLGTYSGASVPGMLTSTGGAMLVHFTSDGSTTAAGWDATYTSTSTTNYCSGTSFLTSPSGAIDDGSGGNNYSSNANCRWLIQPAGAGTITLTFNYFDTETGADSVIVYDGATASSPVLGSYSGSSLPPALSSSGGAMLVHFLSDGSVEFTGWSANYTSTVITPYCSGTTQLFAAAGFLDDGSDSLEYANNSDCKWLIQPAQATSITLTILTLITEFNTDYVNVYDGPTTSSPLIASYSGFAIFSSVTSSGGSMLVHFTSNSSSPADGWGAMYTSTTSGSGTTFCSGTTTLNTASGSFTDGSGTSDYGDNSDCKWLIQPSGATSITLDFTAFATESGADMVNVYDGSATTDSLLGSFSGTAMPPNITSTGGAMLVHFTSNASSTDLGWDANYTSSTTGGGSYCNGTTTFTSPSGSFSDGSGTSDYGNNADCKWLIQPSGVTSVTLNFTAFDIEYQYDLVEIYDGATVADSILGTYSGDTLPDSITSTGGIMLVHFTTDGSIVASGWDANYTTTTVGTGGTSYCSGVTNLTAASGSFSDGSGTNDYGNNADCKWLIQPSGAASITLDFTAFDTETTYDKVKVYDGPTTSSNILGTFSGTSLPTTVTSTGGDMLLHFTSDGSIVKTGWDATYTSSTTGGGSPGCSGTTTMITVSGTFSDGSAANDYASNSDCKWLIQPSGATSVTLSFSSFDTEVNYDFVRVYDGASTTDSLIGEFSGSSQPGVITSSGGVMLVHFTSDNIINKPGWDANYNSNTGSGSGNVPVTDFTSTLITIEVGQTVDFIDLTSDNPVVWTWVFTNGSPATSITQYPTGIVYNTVGCYPVTLTAANSYGQNTVTKQCYINVISPVGLEEGTPAMDVRIFPNPSHGNVTIQVSETLEPWVELMVFDGLGRAVFSKYLLSTGNGISKQFVLDELRAGMYLVQITTGSGVINRRLIIQ